MTLEFLEQIRTMLDNLNNMSKELALDADSGTEAVPYIPDITAIPVNFQGGTVGHLVPLSGNQWIYNPL